MHPLRVDRRQVVPGSSGAEKSGSAHYELKHVTGTAHSTTQ